MPSRRLAVLIDADNAQASIMQNIFQEIAKLGEITVKRIYGDFTSPQMKKWKERLQPLAISPVQQFAYTTGKNATDSSLIIDAMDLLHTRTVDGFCLVSSDSDYTGLAMRIREAGLIVHGFGKSTTPKSFRTACHKFTLTELLRSTPEDGQPATPIAFPGKTAPAQPATGPERPLPTDLVDLLQKAISQTAGDDGWALLSAVGSYLTQIKPDFDARSYGYGKLSNLARGATGLFPIEERPMPYAQSPNAKEIFIRCSEKS